MLRGIDVWWWCVFIDSAKQLKTVNCYRMLTSYVNCKLEMNVFAGQLSLCPSWVTVLWVLAANSVSNPSEYPSPSCACRCPGAASQFLGKSVTAKWQEICKWDIRMYVSNSEWQFHSNSWPRGDLSWLVSLSLPSLMQFVTTSLRSLIIHSFSSSYAL